MLKSRTIVHPAPLLFLRSPFLFGYAKPVPVNFRALRNSRRDMVWVAAAGPAISIVLALDQRLSAAEATIKALQPKP
jgi:Zn-dependent protease